VPAATSGARRSNIAVMSSGLADRRRAEEGDPGQRRHYQGVVHLRGKVDSAEAKTAAGDIAKGIDGVKSVKNDLQVVAPTARKAVDASDSDIAKAVGTRLSKDTQLKKADVRTDAGVVTLAGQLPTIGASAKASEMARGVPGVKSVKNELTFTK
jgi:hyperosmotically inducible periplasmic protein